MKYVNFIFIGLLLSLCSINGNAQDQSVDTNAIQLESIELDSIKKKEWFQFSGYLKYMQTLGFQDLKNIQVDNLLHNRLNFKAYLPKGNNFTLQLRNRVFYGASVNLIPGYGELISKYDGVLPFEFLWLSDGENGIIADSIGLAFATNIDRFYYEYTGKQIDIRIGRQRINWGINTTWNPNDLFNSYNIYDFDYEEREGADAIRLKYYPTAMSSFDVAYKFTNDWSTDIFAMKYLFNKKGYDFQFLAGKFQEKIAFGAGWAGNIKSIGFKGEATYFEPFNIDTLGNLSSSVTFDYSWGNGLYLLGTYLYNSTGENHKVNPYIQTTNVPNAEYLMPAKHNSMIQTSYQFSPIFRGAIGVIYGFEINSLTIFPTLTFSLKENLDLDIIGQLFYQELTNNQFTNIGNGVFWRIRRSF